MINIGNTNRIIKLRNNYMNQEDISEEKQDNAKKLITLVETRLENVDNSLIHYFVTVTPLLQIRRVL